MSVAAADLVIPPPPRPLVVRNRLLERLDQGTRGPLTLLSAPAGFGKTSLLSTWLATEASRVAWLAPRRRLGEASFWAEWLSAIQRVVPARSELGRISPPRSRHAAELRAAAAERLHAARGADRRCHRRLPHRAQRRDRVDARRAPSRRSGFAPARAFDASRPDAAAAPSACERGVDGVAGARSRLHARGSARASRRPRARGRLAVVRDVAGPHGRLGGRVAVVRAVVRRRSRGLRGAPVACIGRATRV